MRYLLLIMVVAMFSCKQDSPAKTNNPSTSQVETNAPITSQQPSTTGTVNTHQNSATPKAETSKKAATNYNKAGIPDACDLLSPATIAKYVNQPASEIFLADGSSPKNPKSRACFFKWDGSALPNAGVMVQLQQNPVAEDVPDYFTYLISSKKTEGENDPGTQTLIKYKDWKGFGDDGAYSTEAGKYVWRIGNDWAFMVAFNTMLRPNEQKKAAEAFAKEVMSNMDI